MADRLTAADAAYLQAEDGGAAQHVGTLSIFDDPLGRVHHAELTRRVRQQLPTARRYRQVVREMPARLGRPVWVDDPHFDLDHHVRRSVLPRGSGERELYELVARVMSQPLDRSRPLWELRVVEGLADGRVALLSKSHHALVDGVTTVDIGQLVLDADPLDADPDLHSPDAGADRAGGDAGGASGQRRETWAADPAPGTVGLLAGALFDVARRPGQVVEAVRHGASDVRGTAGRVAGVATGMASAALSAVGPAAASPLRGRVGAQRLFATVDMSLADHKLVRESLGGTVNDVVLATITGALRTWLLTRGAPVSPAATVRAVVPASVRADAAQPGAGGPRRGATPPLGSVLSSYFVDLPVGEPSAAMRLLQVGYATQAHKDSGQAIGAASLVRLAGFAPPTLHALGARLGSTLTQRSSHLVITNVPGPQSAVFLAGARLERSYPVAPLPPGQSVSIGVTSYAGVLSYGLYANRETMSDLEVLGQCLVDSLAELVEAAR